MEKMKRLILAFCYLFVLVGCSKTEPIPDKAETTYVGGLDYYLPLAEEHDFKDESVEITGEYTKKLFSNSYYIGDVDSDFYVIASFGEQTDKIDALKSGEIITVKGRCTVSKSDHLQLTDCVLVSVAEPEPKPENTSFSVHFIDVGQADAALVECDGHYMLIDGGNKADSDKIYSVLKKADVNHLDIVVGTHAHEDHIGGIPGAFNYADAGLTLCATQSYDSDAFKDFKKYADQKGGGIVVPAVGDQYSLGSASIKILGVNSDTGTNNTSIVLMITYGKTKFLFTGDAEREAEQVILNSGAKLSATVLKVGHHGSDTSTMYVVRSPGEYIPRPESGIYLNYG